MAGGVEAQDYGLVQQPEELRVQLLRAVLHGVARSRRELYVLPDYSGAKHLELPGHEQAALRSGSLAPAQHDGSPPVGGPPGNGYLDHGAFQELSVQLLRLCEPERRAVWRGPLLPADERAVLHVVRHGLARVQDRAAHTEWI